MEYKGWKYFVDIEDEGDNKKYFHFARKAENSRIEEIMLDYDPYKKIMWYGDFCELIDKIEFKPAEKAIDDMNQFMEDICIVLQGKKASYYSGTFEKQIVNESYGRLTSMGLKLIIDRAAQRKYDSMKEKVLAHEIQCKEDGIELK